MDSELLEKFMKFLSFCVFAAVSVPFAAQAQSDFPNKPIRMLVGFPPGSTADIIGRQLATRMSETIGQQVIVENRSGAGSSIAAEVVVRARADGHTLLLSTIANSINPSLFKLSFDFEKDLAAVALLAETPGLLAPRRPASRN